MNLSIRLSKPGLYEFVTVESEPGPHCSIRGEASRYPEGAMQARGEPWIHVFHLQEASGSGRELLEQIQIAIVSSVFGVIRPIGDELAGIDESLHNLRERF